MYPENLERRASATNPEKEKKEKSDEQNKIGGKQRERKEKKQGGGVGGTNLNEEHERRGKEEWGIKTRLEIRRTQIWNLRIGKGA